MPTVQLSPHFTLAEFTYSDTANACGIDNTPPPAAVDQLKKTAELLEIVRAALGGKPVQITSGYRCSALNAEVDGVANSQHCTGQAADFVVPAYGTPDQVYAAIAKLDPPVPFDQLIREYGSWVHISQSATPRHQLLQY